MGDLIHSTGAISNDHPAPGLRLANRTYRPTQILSPQNLDFLLGK